MGGTFKEELKKAGKKRGRILLQSEINRVHKESMKDERHAFCDTAIQRPWHGGQMPLFNSKGML